MLNRSHLEPFVRETDGTIRVEYLADPEGRVVEFLDRLCRLVRRLEGCPRTMVAEALRRQERRVRDASRLAGIAKALLDLCDFVPPQGAGRAATVREAVFRARGKRWPPVPGDRLVPYEEAGAELGLDPREMERLLYADAPGARVLKRAPALDGRALLARYNVELARAVLLDAERVRFTARGGWRRVFSAVKAARLMHTVTRAGRSYQVEVTGPAAAFIVRSNRYGVRLARVLPALMRTPGWRLEADVRRGDAVLKFAVRSRPRAAGEKSPIGGEARRARYDSKWERSLADDFRKRFGAARSDWTLSHETAPVDAGDELFFPDFTLRHADGREALVELVGFWTPEYLEAKARKVAAAQLDNLVLVVYRGLAVGGERAGRGVALESLTTAAGMDRIVWFADKPRAAEVVKAAERWARG
jgi:predicted nuclease of restriction endonuclease-like RecB superfamily